MKKFPLKTLPAAVMAISAAMAGSTEAADWNAGTQVAGGFDFAVAKNAGGEMLIAQWLTYDALGRPLRLLGLGSIKGNGATMSLYAVSDEFKLAADEYLLPPPSTDEYLLPPPSTDEYLLPPPTAKEYLLPPPSTDEYLLPPPSTDEYLLPPPTAKEYLLPPPGAKAHELPAYWGEISIQFVSCSEASIIGLTADGGGKVNTVATTAGAKACQNPLDTVRAMVRGDRF
ncbi:MAG: hypothetical protein R3F04_00490 [Lysobacteraceae bacterium]